MRIVSLVSLHPQLGMAELSTLHAPSPTSNARWSNLVVSCNTLCKEPWGGAFGLTTGLSARIASSAFAE